ncbi:MAG: hypothetical protein M5U08_20875 [Burkholderiales bacterium]|nr:hypothetical protein [Burkholderiales bacterium]
MAAAADTPDAGNTARRATRPAPPSGDKAPPVRKAASTGAVRKRARKPADKPAAKRATTRR